MATTVTDSIKVVGVDGLENISAETFQDDVVKLQKALAPGTPVLFRNYSEGGKTIGRSYDTSLLYSNGNLSSDGKFEVQKGNRNCVYASVHGDPSCYSLDRLTQNNIARNHLIIPSTWTSKVFNEGTFSPSGGSSWTEIHGKGTEEIIVGDRLIKEYPEATNAIQFASNAVHFELPSFYCNLDYLVNFADDHGLRGKEEGESKRKRSGLLRDASLIRASSNLVMGALNEVHEYYNNFFPLTQIGWFLHQNKGFLEKGYPVDNRDFFLRERQHPQRMIGFVKTHRTGGHGTAYILPINNDENKDLKVDEVIELAFSDDHVKKYYPVGFKD